MIGLALILVVRFAPQGVIPERLRKRGVLAFSTEDRASVGAGEELTHGAEAKL